MPTFAEAIDNPDQLRLVFLAENEASLQPFREVRQKTAINDVARLLDVHDKRDDFVQPTVVRFVQLIRIYRCQIGLDGCIQLVDDIVATARFDHEPTVAGDEHRPCALEHLRQYIGEPQRLS